MVVEFDRSLKVAQLIKKEIAIIIKDSLRDPRISFMVSIVDVKLSIDLSYAKIFLAFIRKDNSKNIKNTIQILQNASSYIRHLLSKRIRLRKTPKLFFRYDNSFIYATRISNIIDNAIKKDNKNIDLKYFKRKSNV